MLIDEFRGEECLFVVKAFRPVRAKPGRGMWKVDCGIGLRVITEESNASILLASISNTKQDAWVTLISSFILTFCQRLKC